MKNYQNTYEKPFRILPKNPRDGYVRCEKCGGTGWLLEDGKWLTNCPDCTGGLVRTCKYCGKPAHKSYYGVCDSEECQEKYRKETEKKRLEKARIIEYDSDEAKNFKMYYSEFYPYNDGYFSDIEEFFDSFDSEDRPQYIYGTTEDKLEIDMYDVVSDACYDLHEDAMSCISGIDELQKIVDDWCNKQHGTGSYMVDYGVAIRIPLEITHFEDEQDVYVQEY